MGKGKNPGKIASVVKWLVKHSDDIGDVAKMGSNFIEKFPKRPARPSQPEINFLGIEEKCNTALSQIDSLKQDFEQLSLDVENQFDQSMGEIQKQFDLYNAALAEYKEATKRKMVWMGICSSIGIVAAIVLAIVL